MLQFSSPYAGLCAGMISNLRQKVTEEKEAILASIEKIRLSLFLMKFSSLYAGMCAGMIYNLWRKLTEDKEDVLASMEKFRLSLCLM
jgi:hypothetical protein